MEHFGEDLEKDLEALARLPEHEPLLSAKSKGSGGSSSYGTHPHHEYRAAASEAEQSLQDHGITDTMHYRTQSLTTWNAFFITYTTIWFSKELWIMMLRLSAVTVVTALLAVLAIPKPDDLQVSKFTQISKFLNVVVGLLLGFFMSSSMNRWHSCVNGFLELLDAIRNLQMQFVALGVPEKEAVMTLRYGFASAWLLYGQLLLETKIHAKGQSKERAMMWEKLTQKVAHIDRTGKTFLLADWEVEVLSKTRDPPGMMWMWVAALIGRMAQDGDIPPMCSPTYGRIMNLCQSAHGGIRQVRAAISIQAPLTYTHMLATLVHINNLLNALTLGLVSGVALGTYLMAHDMHFHTKRAATAQEATQDWQNMAVTFLYCFFGPLIYQALLLIAMHLAQPFDSEDARIPLDRLLHQLEVDMCNGRDLVDHMSFEKPNFRETPASARMAAK